MNPAAPANVHSLLLRSAAERCVGRDSVRRVLARLLDDDGPLVIALHGVAGIGKTAVASALAGDAQARGIALVWLDGGQFEPTPAGLLAALSARCVPPASPAIDAIGVALAAMGPRVVLVIDGYEHCRLVDDWLRREWLPRMGVGVRLLLAGRDVPVPAWHRAPGWGPLFEAIELGPLDDAAAHALLLQEGLEPAQAAAAARLAGGHPLALRLAASASARAAFAGSGGWHRVVDTLVGLWLEDVHDPLLRRALCVTSVVRRITVSLLRALLHGEDAQRLYDRLAALPMATATVDGLRLDDTVREAISAHFMAADPAAHRASRRAAWQLLQEESRSAAPRALWRYTADMLHLAETPSVREVFFPRGSQPLAVEDARPQDLQAALTLAQRLEGEEMAAAARHWIDVAPRSFRVVRNAGGDVTAFHCLLDIDNVDPRHLQSDAATRTWLAHLADEPVEPGEAVLLLPLVVGSPGGPASPERAALILDLKRHYLEMRPRLRRLYAEVPPGTDFEPFLRPTGFRVLADHPVRRRHREGDSVLLDFGPGSVDGWLSRLVAASLNEPSQPAVAVDEAARELLVDGQRAALTRRELEVLQYLMQRAGEAVKRGDLLDDIWGTRYEGGSNVVDVVVAALRRKLGVRASAIETVNRFGYRFRAP